MKKTPFVFAGLALLAGAGTALAAWSSILPTGEGTYLQWTPSSGATHYTLVDETTCNGVTDYVRTTTVGQRDSYGVSLSGVPSGALITRIDVKPCASRQTGGGTTPVMKVFYRLNGVNSADVGSYSLSGTTPVELATTSWTGLSITKTATTTLESGVVLFSGTKGARLSRLATAVEYTALPLTPTNFVATWPNSSSLSIQLAWTDTSSDETGFLIERSSDNANFSIVGSTSPNTTSTSNNVTTAGTYYYRIASVNIAGKSGYSSTTLVTVAPPIAPSDLAITSQSPSQVNLSWSDNSSSEQSFRIERAVNDGSFVQIATTSPNTVVHSDAAVSQGNWYAYRIASVNIAGSSAYGSTTPSTPSTTPASPSSLNGTLVGTSSPYISIAWTDNSMDELGFHIERAFNSTTSFASFAEPSSNFTSWSDFTSASSTGTWYYRIRTFNLFGSSMFSNIASVFVP
jgi:hypothetical protein